MDEPLHDLGMALLGGVRAAGCVPVNGHWPFDAFGAFCQTPLPRSAAMDTTQFWDLIESARSVAGDPADSDQVASEASTLLAARSREEIIAAEQAMYDLMGDSYRLPLWAAAYVINGGCSDDGFDYFRGWLILQGKDVFERVVADPDSLAELPVIRAAAAGGEDIDGEMALSIASAAMRVTGDELPAGGFTIRHPELDKAWDFDFDDQAEMVRRLPRLSALYSG